MTLKQDDEKITLHASVEKKIACDTIVIWELIIQKRRRALTTMQLKYQRV